MADQNTQYMAILTAVGEAKQANANALGVPWLITQMGVGDANGTEPPPNRLQTALLNERRRAPLNQLGVHPDNAAMIVAEQVIPENVGGWWIREIGLYDEDGDLVAVANCPPTFKPELAQGSARTQVVRLNVVVSSTQNIQLKIDPAVVLATRAYADSLINVHQAAANPHPQYKLRGAVTTLSASAAITAAQLGLLLLDAAGGARTFTLPAANGALGIVEFVLRRVDVTSNALVIAAAGTDKIMLDTTAEAAGQASTELLFAGDYLRLRSDGAGKWWCVGQAQLPGSIASGYVAFGVVGDHSFAVPAVLRSGRLRPLVTVTGGGGGGGGGSSTTRGAGGGGGGTAIGKVNLSGIITVPVSVGAGGGGGSAQSSGSGASSSSFGSYLSATGGGGGGGGTATGQPAGGVGGIGSGEGSLFLIGGQGSDGPFQYNGSNLAGTGGSGDGGGSYWGGGSRSASGTATGPAARGGGGGGCDTTGGAGTPGIVEIKW